MSERTEKLSIGAIDGEDAGRTSAETRAQFGTAAGGGAGVTTGDRDRLTLFGLFGRDASALRVTAASAFLVAGAPAFRLAAPLPAALASFVTVASPLCATATASGGTPVVAGGSAIAAKEAGADGAAVEATTGSADSESCDEPID
jgi:hypothetical protein